MPAYSSQKNIAQAKVLNIFVLEVLKKYSFQKGELKKDLQNQNILEAVCQAQDAKILGLD